VTVPLLSAIECHSVIFPPMSPQSPDHIADKLHELRVAKAELMSGDVTGLVYCRKSPGSAFLVTPRIDAIREVEEKVKQLSMPVMPAQKSR